MSIRFSAYDTRQKSATPKEGDLFKVIGLYGKTFEIRYGFYEERDRHTQFAEPVPIYPDFIEAPQYTDDGTPFVTAMQNPCESFDGKKDANSVCGDCALYRSCEELLGICSCPTNHRRQCPTNEGAWNSPDPTIMNHVSIKGGHSYDS